MLGPVKTVPLRILIAGMILFVAGPCLGLLLTGIGMIGAFHSLGQNGIADPHTLAGHIDTALVATVVGFVMSGFGVVTMMVALILHFTGRKSPGSPPNP